MATTRRAIPVSFFSMAVGVLALANAWQVAVRLWSLPQDMATALTVAGLALWLALLALYAHKWLRHRAQARAELQHPLQGTFLALLPVSSLLAAMALRPALPALALCVFAAALAAAVGVGAWLFGRFWQGSTGADLVTPAVYLPAVAQNFVGGTAASAFGLPQLGAWLFGAGLLSWLAIESTVLNRAATREPLPAPMRPLLGIQLAPPVVGGVTWLSLNHGVPDIAAQMLLGYGLFQAVLLLRLLPWIRHKPWTPAWWSFSFGIAALPALAMRLVEGGATGAVATLAPITFVAANAAIGLLVLKTAALGWRGTLLPVVTGAAR